MADTKVRKNAPAKSRVQAKADEANTLLKSAETASDFRAAGNAFYQAYHQALRIAELDEREATEAAKR